MDSAKVKSKTNRDEKQATAKLDEQIEKLIKSLGSSGTIEQKLTQLAKNYVELERESNKQTTSLKQSEKVLEKELRDKEHLQREYNKGVLIRDKLEQVCREQQKLMKSIKSESMTKIRDEEEKRKETQAHFQKSINEIFATLGKNNDENLKIKEANAEMTKKFKYLAEQYELREKQLEKLNEQIKLETQLNEAKLAKVHMESTIEKEILLKEKQAALEEVLATKKAIVEMETRERLLKEQLTVYTDKYDQFQNSLQKSNDVFATYKVELEKMGKKTRALEKEAYEWRSKYEKSNRALLNTISDKQAQDEYVKKSARQLAQLQKLCRTLQAERTALLDTLKANNIERPPMPELPAEPTDIEPPPKPTDKLEMMTQNCKELHAQLAQLQNQLTSIEKDGKSKEKVEASGSKKAKPKKNKPKNNKNMTESQSNGTNGANDANEANGKNQPCSAEADSMPANDDSATDVPVGAVNESEAISDENKADDSSKSENHADQVPVDANIESSSVEINNIEAVISNTDEQPSGEPKPADSTTTTETA